jgi:hypothetical protein
MITGAAKRFSSGKRSRITAAETGGGDASGSVSTVDLVA